MTEPVPDDPLLTAYALGELEGEELSRVARRVAADPAARGWVEEVRQTVDALDCGLSAPGETHLDVARRQAVLVAAMQAERRRARRSRRTWWRVAAAVLLAAAGLAAGRWLGRDGGEPAASHPRGESGYDSSATHSASGADAAVPVPPSNGSEQEARAAREGRRPVGAGTIEPTPVPPAGTVPATDAPSPRRRVSLTPPAISSPRRKGEDAEIAQLSRLTRESPPLSRADLQGEFWDGVPNAQKDLIRDAVKERARGKGARRTRVQRPRSDPWAEVADHFFKWTDTDPTSTFDLHVDSVTLPSLRQALEVHSALDSELIRIEELVNAFPYAVPASTGIEPLSWMSEVASCPWRQDHKLVRLVGTARAEDDARPRPPAHIVLAVDLVTLPEHRRPDGLLFQSVRALLDNLRDDDRIVVAAQGGESPVLGPTSPSDRDAILGAVGAALSRHSDRRLDVEPFLRAAAGPAEEDATRCVIFCSDSLAKRKLRAEVDQGDLLAAWYRAGVSFSVMELVPNLSLRSPDPVGEEMAYYGGGVVAVVSEPKDAVHAWLPTLGTPLLSDVVPEVAFNREKVQSFRLLGFENRPYMMAGRPTDRDPSRTLRAGTQWTILYEVVPRRDRLDRDPASLADTELAAEVRRRDALLGVVLHHRGEAEVPRHFVPDSERIYTEVSDDFRFTAGVAAFGLSLRSSPFAGGATLLLAAELAADGVRDDPDGLRKEFVDVIRRVRDLR